MGESETYTAFSGTELLVRGPLADVLAATKPLVDEEPSRPLLIFEDGSGRQVDFDFTGSVKEVVDRARPKVVANGPGRPRLGVVSREISLLPRHWEWLESRPEGCSAALRRLVEEAQKRDPEAEHRTRARDAAHKFLWAIAGNYLNFEEVTRALYAGEHEQMFELMLDWPEDVREHTRALLGLGSNRDPRGAGPVT